jgi:uncharacterized membrane protein YgdD (TMEM256/DUF423 family)
MATARNWIIVSALLLGSATVLGAFGSHALQAQVSAEQLDVWRVAVDYQFFHALGLLGIAILMQRWTTSSALPWVAWLMFAGVLLFCGTIYLAVLGAPRWINILTPVGGLAFMLAWLVTAIAAWRQPSVMGS